ncbi:MAG: amino acid ABC transporter permease [Deltaproteobacteria bacterium]|nr:amino acid ABC transporter permease [Deltaproteobacteria bacterium]
MSRPASSSFPCDRLNRPLRLTFELIKYFLALGLIVFLVDAGLDELGYNWQWYRLWRFFWTFGPEGWTPGPLLSGLWVTIRISALGLVLATVFGLVAALLRLSGSYVGRLVAMAYLETIRNTPLLVQIFVMYFVLSPVLGIDAFTSAVVALSLFEGAYASEIFRAGILSVPIGQWEAGLASGLTRPQIYRRIVLPQALRHAIPPLTGQAVSLVKDSALVSTIAIYDLTMQAQAIVSQTFLTFEVWFAVAGVYLVLNLILSLTATLLERRMALRS